MNLDVEKADGCLQELYRAGAVGGYFADLVGEYFDYNMDHIYKTRDSLEHLELIEPCGERHKLTQLGLELCESNISISAFLAEREAQKKAQQRYEKIEREKLFYDARLSKLQVKTFWPLFIIALIGGVCGIISLAMQLGWLNN